MSKLIILILMLSIYSLFGCRSTTSKEPKVVQPAPNAEIPVVKKKQYDGREHIDEINFMEYQDDGDHLQLLAQIGDSTISLINETDTSRNLNRGDRIRVTWKYGTITIPGDNDAEMTAQLMLSIKKIGDGPVSEFRRTYGRKLKYTWSTDEEFTSSYLDKIYLLTEYYLTQTKNPLLQASIKNGDEITYSIESNKKDDRNYRVIGIAPAGPNGSNIVQWLYVDEESGKSYEYNLAENSLIAFK